jgi:flagellar M-ring protein FliF
VEFLRQLYAGIMDAWRRLSLSARVNIVVTSVITIGLILIMVVAGSRPQYVHLFSGLDPDDSSAIENYLNEQGIPYKVHDVGQTLLVRQKDWGRVMKDLSRLELPKRHAGARGFDLFDKVDLTTDQYLKNVNYMRAVQGELQGMLNNFEWVDNSFVFIREAERELFVSKQLPSEAAITLDVNRLPTQDEVETVLAIVSSFGGANLDRQHITISTTDQGPLYLPPEDGVAALVRNKHDLTRKIEREAQDSAESALRAMNVRSVVRVSANVDFSQKKETTQEALEGTPIAVLTNTMTRSSTESLPEGEAGARANLPEGVVARGAVQTTETEKEEIENLEPTYKTTETITDPGSEITGYSVAAIVEGRYEDELDEQGVPTGKKTYVARTDEELEIYRDIIIAAVGVGITEELVKVHDHPFDLDRLAAATAPGVGAPSTVAAIATKAWDVGKWLVVLIGFLVVRWLLLRAIVKPEVAGEVVEEVVEIDEAEERRREVADAVQRAVQEQPEQVAAILRTWLSEDED